MVIEKRNIGSYSSWCSRVWERSGYLVEDCRLNCSQFVRPFGADLGGPGLGNAGM